MKKFLRIYRQLLVSNVGRILAYRTDFFNSIFSSLCWGGFSVLTVFLITEKVPVVVGWTREGLLILTCTYMIIMGFFYALFSSNFTEASTVIHKGELDGILLKPIDPSLFLTMKHISYSHIVRLCISMSFLIWLVFHFQIVPSVIDSILAILLMGVSVLFIYTVHFMTTVILLSQTYLHNLVDLAQAIVAHARAPREILVYSPRLIHILLLPALLAINIPARAILGQVNSGEAIFFSFGTFVFYAVVRLWWTYSLRHYGSASG